MITDIKKVVYDVKYFWDLKYNPNATIQNALPNCTTLAYGLIIADGKLPPVKTITNAGTWDSVLSNGWIAVDYSKDNIEVGDILQWKKKGHVATISRISEDKIIVSSSFYTGEHGCSIYNGKYDTRNSFKSLKQLSDFMLENYKNRYFHCWDIDEEFKWVSGVAEKILKHPLYSVKENKSKNQIEVLTFEQNVRDKKNNILKKAEKGFFNVLSTTEMNGMLWYEVEKNKYIAQVDGRVVYHEAQSDDNKELEELKKENQELKRILKEINKLSEVDDG